MITKRAIIVGSGASIRKGLWHIPPNKLPIWSAIQNELTIGINWVFKWMNPTVTMYGDFEFYRKEHDNLQTLPLVFGMQDSYYTRSTKIDWTKRYHLKNNIYLLPNRVELDGKILYHSTNAWKYGFYSRFFSGILGMNLAIALGCSEIYMLGFDCNSTERRTHFYQDVFNAFHKTESGKLVTGVGKNDKGKYNTSLYNQDFNEKYLPFQKELNRIKIFNVSMDSGITVFPKISYKEFYQRLLYKNEYKNQNVLRKEILQTYKGHYNV